MLLNDAILDNTRPRNLISLGSRIYYYLQALRDGAATFRRARKMAAHASLRELQSHPKNFHSNPLELQFLLGFPSFACNNDECFEDDFASVSARSRTMAIDVDPQCEWSELRKEKEMK